MSNIGKKIPSDIIKDHATRQSFSRVEDRLKTIEAQLGLSATELVTSLDCGANYGGPGAAAVLNLDVFDLAVRTNGNQRVLLHFDESLDSGGNTLRLPRIYVINAAAVEASAFMYLFRNGTRIKQFDLKIQSGAGAGNVYMSYGIGSFNCFDLPPIGINRYQLKAVAQGVGLGTVYFDYVTYNALVLK